MSEDESNSSGSEEEPETAINPSKVPTELTRAQSLERIYSQIEEASQEIDGIAENGGITLKRQRSDAIDETYEPPKKLQTVTEEVAEGLKAYSTDDEDVDPPSLEADNEWMEEMQELPEFIPIPQTVIGRAQLCKTGVSFKAIVCMEGEGDYVSKRDQKKCTFKTYVLTALENVSIPHVPSDAEAIIHSNILKEYENNVRVRKEEIERLKKELSKEQTSENLNKLESLLTEAEMDIRPTQHYRDPIVFNKGETVHIACFKSITAGKEVYPGMKVLVLNASFSLRVSDKNLESKSVDPFLKDMSSGEAKKLQRVTILRPKGEPMIAFAGMVSILEEPTINELQYLLSSSTLNKKKAVATRKAHPKSTVEMNDNGFSVQYNRIEATPLRLMNTMTNDELIDNSMIKYGCWIQIRNYLSFYDNIPSSLLKDVPSVVFFDVPIMDPNDSSPANYLAIDNTPGSTDRTMKIPTIRDSNNALCGETAYHLSKLGHAMLSMPIFRAHTYFPITNHMRWKSIGPSLWRALDALCWFTVNPTKTQNMQADRFVVDNFNGEGYVGDGQLIIDCLKTLQWAGLEVTRDFAFKHALRISLSKPVNAFIKKEDEPYKVISSYSESNVFSKNLQSEVLKGRVKWASLLEVSGKLPDLFELSDGWKFYVVPPFNYTADATKTPKEILQMNNFFLRNNHENANELNEKAILDEGWFSGTEPEIIAVRPY